MNPQVIGHPLRNSFALNEAVRNAATNAAKPLAFKRKTPLAQALASAHPKAGASTRPRVWRVAVHKACGQPTAFRGVCLSDSSDGARELLTARLPDSLDTASHLVEVERLCDGQHLGPFRVVQDGRVVNQIDDLSTAMFAADSITGFFHEKASVTAANGVEIAAFCYVSAQLLQPQHLHSELFGLKHFPVSMQMLQPQPLHLGPIVDVGGDLMCLDDDC